MCIASDIVRGGCDGWWRSWCETFSLRSGVECSVRLWGRCTVVESCGSAKCSCTAPSVRQRRVFVEEEEEHRQQQSCVERAESVGRRLTPRPRRLPLDSTLGGGGGLGAEGEVLRYSTTSTNTKCNDGNSIYFGWT